LNAYSHLRALPGSQTCRLCHGNRTLGPRTPRAIRSAARLFWFFNREARSLRAHPDRLRALTTHLTHHATAPTGWGALEHVSPFRSIPSSTSAMPRCLEFSSTRRRARQEVAAVRAHEAIYHKPEGLETNVRLSARPRLPQPSFRGRFGRSAALSPKLIPPRQEKCRQQPSQSTIPSVRLENLLRLFGGWSDW
jgi:hypothetical protein